MCMLVFVQAYLCTYAYKGVSSSCECLCVCARVGMCGYVYARIRASIFMYLCIQGRVQLM